MKNTEVFIKQNAGAYTVKVTGRATFECVTPLRTLAKELENIEFKNIDVDLSECTNMDSTFMGILAMLGLNARKIGASMTVFNAGDENKKALFGLGLKKLFNYSDGQIDVSGVEADAADPNGRLDAAKTVLDAHRTLMNVDEGNVKKFERVVDLVRKDIDKMDGAEEE